MIWSHIDKWDARTGQHASLNVLWDEKRAADIEHAELFDFYTHEPMPHVILKGSVNEWLEYNAKIAARLKIEEPNWAALA